MVRCVLRFGSSGGQDQNMSNLDAVVLLLWLDIVILILVLVLLLLLFEIVILL